MATSLIPKAEAAEKLRLIFEKVFPASGGPGGDPADFAAWFRNGIIDLTEFEFLVSNQVECDATRRSFKMAVQPPDADSHATLTVRRQAPQPKSRTVPLEEIAALIDRAGAGTVAHVPVGSDGSKNPDLLFPPPYFGVRLSEFSGVAIGASQLIVGLGEEYSGELPAVRALLQAEGVKILFDRKVPGFSSADGSKAMPSGSALCCEIPPSHGGSVGGLVQRLLQTCGLPTGTEITYSSGILDEREPGFVAAEGEVHAYTAISSVRCSTNGDFSPAELGLNVDPGQFDFIRDSIVAATQETPGVQVTAAQLLASAALVAREKFGPDAAARLRALGLDSSSAFGRILYQLVDAGIFCTSAEDDPKDFEIPSEFDAIFEG